MSSVHPFISLTPLPVEIVNAGFDWGAATNAVLAAAAVIAAFLSWRTAAQANQLAKTSAENEARRSRRETAVDIRDWYNRSWWAGLWKSTDPTVSAQLDAMGNELRRRLEIADDQSGLQLMRELQLGIYDHVATVNKATAKDIAKVRHPSHFRRALDTVEDRISAWRDGSA